MLLADFLKTLDADNTRETYARYLERFLAWLNRPLTELTPRLLSQYVTYLKQQGYSATSIHLQISAVRSYLRWLVSQEQINPDVYAAALAVKTPAKPQRLPRALSREQLDQLLSAIDLSTDEGRRDYAFILFAVTSGARITELLQLRVENLDIYNRCAIVCGKGNKERVIYITDEVVSALLYYLQGRTSGLLFPVTQRAVQLRLQGYSQDLGFEVTPHMLRHTFAVAALNATQDLHSVSRLLGHSDIRTTQIYVAAATEHLRAVVEAGSDWRNSAASTKDRETEARIDRDRQRIPTSSGAIRG